MAGWLGSNLTSRLDGLRSQVTSIAKEVFVEEGSGDNRLEYEDKSDIEILKEKCFLLESKNQELILEKEDQCNNFRQLLVEKEEEIQELEKMLESWQTPDTTQGEEGETNILELKRSLSRAEKVNVELKEKNKKLLAERDRLKSEAEGSRAADKLVARLETENRTLSEQYETATASLTALRQSFEDSLVEQTRQMASMETARDEVQERLEDAEARLAEMSAGFEAELKAQEAGWKEERAKLCQHLESLQAAAAAQQVAAVVNNSQDRLLQQLQAAEKLSAEHEKELKMEKEKLLLEQRNMEQLAKEKEAMDVKLQAMERLSAESEEAKKTLIRQLESADQLSTERDDERNNLLQRLKDAEYVANEMEKEKNNLLQQLQASEELVSKTSQKVQTLEKSLSQASSISCDSSEERTRLVAEHKESSDQLVGARYRCTELEASLEETVRGREELQQLVQVQVDQLSTLHSNCDTLNTQVNKLKEKLKLSFDNREFESKVHAQEKEELENKLRDKEVQVANLEGKVQELELKRDNLAEGGTGLKNESEHNHHRHQQKGGRRGRKVGADKNGNEDEAFDITSLVEENKELKEKVFILVQDANRKHSAERKLEAGELSILLKMKNVDLEQKYFTLQQENNLLTMQNSDLKSRSETSSAMSFTSYNDSTCPNLVEATSLLSEPKPEVERLEEELRIAKDKIDYFEKHVDDNYTLETTLEKMQGLVEAKAQESIRLGQELEQVRSELNQKISTLEREKLEQVERLSENHEKAKEKMDHIIRTLEETSAEKEDLSEKLTEVLGLLESEKEAVIDLKRQLEEVQKDLVEARTAAAAAEDTAKTGADSNNRLIDEHNSLASTVEQLKAEIITKDSDLNTVLSEVSQLRENFSELTNQLEAHKADSLRVNEKLVESEAYKTKFEAVRMNTDTLNQLIFGKEERIRQLEVEVSELMRTMDLLKQSEREFQSKSEAEGQKVLKLEEETDRLKHMVDTADTKTSEAATEKVALEQKLEQLETDLFAKLTTISTLEAQHKDLSQALTDIKGMNESILAKAANSEKESNKLKKMLEEMERKRKSLDDENVTLTRLVEERMEAEAALAARVRELEATDNPHRDYPEKDSHLIQVLNEKTRELTQTKAENEHLLQQLQEERDRREELDIKQSEIRESYNQMSSETVQRLSSLVRDRDLEIESLKEKVKSLLEILQNEKELDNRCSQLERQKGYLERENKELQERLKENPGDVSSFTPKDNAQHSNELVYLKGRISELEKKLSGVGGGRRVQNQLDSKEEEMEKDYMEVMEKDLKELVFGNAISRVVGASIDSRTSPDNEIQKSVEAMRQHCSELESRLSELTQQVAAEQHKVVELEKVKIKLESSLAEEKAANKMTTETLAMRVELDKLRTEKTTDDELLRAKDSEVQELRREVRGVIEKKKFVEGEVERLRAHLVEVEEGYTQELMVGEEREQELRSRVGVLEDKVRQASLTHNEASQEANEATSHLTEALTAAATSRDSLAAQLKTSNTKLREKTSALRNLQLALEGFQRQRSNEIRQVERKCEDRIEVELRRVREAEEQLIAIKQQLERAGEGLEAAARLSQQLDAKQQVINSLRHEVTAREELLQAAQDRVKSATTAQVGKVDRDLVKNLILGYVTADSSKKIEILRVVATVLDFNQEERGRTGLDTEGGGWLGGFLRGRRDSGVQRTTEQINQSIAQAFVQFLEEESTPHAPVVLPVVEMARSKQEAMANAPKSPSPLLLPSLPSLSPSPNILKSVLEEK